MTIEDWTTTYEGSTWKVKGMTLTVSNVVSVYNAAQQDAQTAEQISMCLIFHPDVQNVAFLGSSFALSMATALTSKALRVLKDSGLVRSRVTSVWKSR